MWGQMRFVVIMWLSNIFFIIHICNIPDCICIAQQCALRVFMWAQMGLVLMLGLNPTRSASVIPKYLRSRINCGSSKNATILRSNMKKFSWLLIQFGQEVKYMHLSIYVKIRIFFESKRFRWAIMHFTGDCMQQLFGLICLVWQSKQHNFVTYADGWTGGWGPPGLTLGVPPPLQGKRSRVVFTAAWAISGAERSHVNVADR